MLCQMRVAPEEFVPFGGDPFAAGSDPFLAEHTSGASVPPLGNNRKNASAPCQSFVSGPALFGQARTEQEKAAREAQEASRKADVALRWRLAKWLRYALIQRGLYKNFRSLCDCHRYAIPKNKNNKNKVPGKVQIHYYASGFNSFDEMCDAGLGFAFVEKCGNSWFCFLDAPKIRYAKRELVKKTTINMLRKGHDLYLETFTAPHDINTDPKVFRKNFAEAKRMFTSGEAYQTIKERYGIIYNIASNELTVDHPLTIVKTGPHFHTHRVVFTKNEILKEQLIELESELKVRWYECLLKFGLCTEDQKEDVLGYGYTVSYKCDEIEKKNSDERAAEYVAKAVSFELSPAIFEKKGRKKERVSHFQFMAYALKENNSTLIDMAIDLMFALKGVHSLRFSKGLLAYAGTEDEDQTAEEILEEKSGLFVDDVDHKDLESIDDNKLQWSVLEATKEQLKSEGVNVVDLPTVTIEKGGKRKVMLDERSIEYRKLREFLQKNISLAVSGIDPLTGEDAQVLAYERDHQIAP